MRRPLFFFLAAVVPLALHARTATFGFVHADDADLIAGNQTFLSDLWNVPRAFTRSYFEVEGELTEQKTYYRPVAIVSFMLDAARAGADPRAYHLTNVVLHAVTTCLLLALAQAWGAPAAAALLAALVFAVHPVNVQAVAWIAGRNDLLLAMFGLLSLLTWTKGALGVGSWVLGLHAAAFAFALFSKETGLFFPALAVLHQRLALRTRLTRAQWIALAADALIVAAWLVLRSVALRGQPSEITTDTLQIAVSNLPQLLVHAGKMLAPLRLNVAPSVDALGLIIGAVAVLLFAFVAWRVMPSSLAAVAAVWFLVFLVPTLVVPGLPVYEHRAYLPLIGIVVIGAALPAGSRKPLLRLKAEATVIVVVAFAFATYSRLPVYRDAFAYWTDAARDAQFGPLANVNLGQLYEADDRLPDARREYLRALERDPNTPKAHNNLGVVLMKLDEPDLAVRHFREETKRHPWNADAWFNLGLVAETRGEPAEARRYYERAIQENRVYRPAYEKLGISPPSSDGAAQRP